MNEMKDKIVTLRGRPGTSNLSRLNNDLTRWENLLAQYLSSRAALHDRSESLAAEKKSFAIRAAGTTRCGTTRF